MHSRFVSFRSLILWLALTVPSHSSLVFSSTRYRFRSPISRVPCVFVPALPSTHSPAPRYRLQCANTHVCLMSRLPRHDTLHNSSTCAICATVRRLDVLVEFWFTVKPEIRGEEGGRGTLHDMSPDETRFLILWTVSPNLGHMLLFFTFLDIIIIYEVLCNMIKLFSHVRWKSYRNV